MKIKLKKEYFIVGIDEAGRGPLAGPVCVGAVGMMMNVRPATPDLPRWTRWTSELLKGVKDSKKVKRKEEGRMV